MDEFGVYKMYLALKLHFTTDNYDVIENKGRVRASRHAFAKRKDLFSIKKISKTYSDEEIANFLISNFVSGNRWGGIFDSEAGKTYILWKGKMESLTYNFNKELDKIKDDLEIQEKPFKFAFEITKAQHPYILKAYLRNDISIETLVILEKIYPFVETFDGELKTDILWPDISRMIKKYKPFLKIDREKYDRLFRKRFDA